MRRSRRPDQLLSPGRIGQLELPNRIVMTPMGSNLAEPDGTLGERIIRYYEERARGGVGLLIVGVGAIAHPAGACNPNQVGISDDSFLPGLRELCRRVHAHGARIAVQLQHAGKVATRDMAAGRPMLTPSVPERKFGDLMNDMTAEEARLFRSFHDEDCDAIPTMAAGSYRSRVVIPANFLGPTTYRLIFRATIYNQRTLPPTGGIPVVLSVEQVGRYNRAYLGDTFRGKIAPCLDWKTELTDGRK
jgi:hypothetical protein